MSLRVARILRHPVKSLGAEDLGRVALTSGEALPFDRAWAVAHGASRFDFDAPDWVPCGNFLRVTHVPRLAQVRARWDAAARRLTLSHPDAPELAGDPDDAEHGQAIANWAGGLVDCARPGPFRLAKGPRAMTDAREPFVSVKSLATLRALSERVGRPLDPLRFRANLWIEGAAPWEEVDWIGRGLRIGDARLRIVEQIGRCAATEANPETGRRDAPVLAALRQAAGETCFGVYASVEAGGDIAVSDAAEILA